MDEATDLINRLLQLKTQHANKDVRDKADQALSAVFHQVRADYSIPQWHLPFQATIGPVVMGPVYMCIWAIVLEHRLMCMMSLPRKI